MIDILVAGGGYVGLSLAVALKKAAPHLQIELVDPAPADAWRRDERASALVAAARNLLDVLGVWNEIAPEAEPIRRMVITDSRTATLTQCVMSSSKPAEVDIRSLSSWTRSRSSYELGRSRRIRSASMIIRAEYVTYQADSVQGSGRFP